MPKEQFAEVMGRWYGYINRDHHKDRDCRFHIDEVWEYGEPKYIVDHWGYLLEDIVSVEFKKIGDAYRYIATRCEAYMAVDELI